MSKKHIYVLGTHVSHHGSACLLKDGEIVVAIEKERLTRVKRDGGEDNAAIKYCLQAEGITPQDIDLVVQNANLDMFTQQSMWRRSSRLAEQAKRVESISHHLAHAYGAAATSPFEEAAILTIDGCGNCYSDCIDLTGAHIPQPLSDPDLAQLYFEKDSYYYWNESRIQAVYKDFSPWGPMQGYAMYPNSTAHSIGGAYTAVSKYVFGGMDDPGKLMGLAPYGKAGVYQYEMFTLKDGRVFYNYDWMKNFDKPARNYFHFLENFHYYADIAYWCQKEVERALMYVINHRYDTNPCKNLAFSGGVALNAVANRLIVTESKFENVHFQPAAGDNGIAIGCAYYGWLEILGNKVSPQVHSPYLGKTYSDDEIKNSLKTSNGITFAKDDDFVETTARYLAEGKTIAWFQGGSEFGPRALGHRSILADPRNEEVRLYINRSVKFREDFRPFAPSVPLDETQNYFEQNYESPYMILVSNVKPEWENKIKAVVHEDSSARVQTVTESMTPDYYRLLKTFKKHSGIPILLNTSLNRRGMPIVETPKDAIEFFKETGLDILVIHNWIVKKEVVKDTQSINANKIMSKLLNPSVTNQSALKKLDTTLNLVVTGVERSLGISCNNLDVKILDGTLDNADTSIILDQEALVDIYNNPQKVEQLFKEKRIKIPGKDMAGRTVLLRVLGQLSQLVRISKDS